MKGLRSTVVRSIQLPTSLSHPYYSRYCLLSTVYCPVCCLCGGEDWDWDWGIMNSTELSPTTRRFVEIAPSLGISMFAENAENGMIMESYMYLSSIDGYRIVHHCC